MKPIKPSHKTLTHTSMSPDAIRVNRVHKLKTLMDSNKSRMKKMNFNKTGVGFKGVQDLTEDPNRKFY